MVVVDVNIVVGLVLPVPYAFEATRLTRMWRQQGEQLVAPVLLEYELATIVRRGMVLRQIEPQMAGQILHQLLRTEVELIMPSPELHQQALIYAGMLGQSKAYDAQYLALAAQQNAPFWTADRRLARSAQAAGLTWVLWIGGEPA